MLASTLRELEEASGKKQTPVIFLTGSDDSETERRGLKAGASDFIRKPFNRDILIRRIYNTVTNAKMIESLTAEVAIDKLTGFLNKAAGTERISKLCETKVGALLVFDLDNFKLINDLYGHDMGDHVLQAFADIVRRNARAEDVMARIGGDEFMAFCPGMDNEAGVPAMIRRLNDQLLKEASRLMGEDFDVPLGISAGAVMVPDYGRDYESLFPLADGALYKVKQNGKHGCAVYRPEEDKAGAGEESAQKILARITKIVEERNDVGGAMLLGMEQFSFIYRFVQRFGKRYGGRDVKLLFVLSEKNSGEMRSQRLKDAEAAFGLCLQDTLRRSDTILMSKPNQFFLLLPELAEADFPNVLRRIMAAWEATNEYDDIRVEHAVQFSVYEKPAFKKPEA